VAHGWWWWLMAHRTAQLLLTEDGGSLAQEQEPDLNRPTPGVGSTKAHEVSGSMTDKLGSRWILDMDDNVIFYS
jgi:hypothetical protein